MTVRVRPLQIDEWDSARALRVLPVQERLVAPVMESLSTAEQYPGAMPLGVFSSGTLVGFMMGQIIPTGREGGDFLVWDYLIDAQYQGKGLGRQGLLGAIDIASQLGANGVQVGCEPSNTIARRLYESLGFVDQGTLNADGENELRLALS
jgi:diamine N-acetyltransferase